MAQEKSAFTRLESALVTFESLLNGMGVSLAMLLTPQEAVASRVVGNVEVAWRVATFSRA
jgi:hypothetical protein